MKKIIATTALIFSGAGCVTSSGTPEAYLDLCERGQAQLRNEDYAGARTTFREILSRHPDEIFNSNVELLLSDCERQLGNESEARRLREKVARGPSSRDLKMRANFGLGKMALAKERFDEAAAKFRAAYASAGEASAEEKASIRLQTGIALQSGGQFAEARKEFERAIEEAPKSLSAKRARTQLLYPDHFAVQTGAYRDPKNAEREQARLKGKGYPAEVIPMELPQGRLNCVRVGKFADRREAVELLDRMQASKAFLPKSKPTVKP